MATENDLPADLLEERGDARLHIGGLVRKPGWQVLNVQAGEHVDHVGDLRDLSRFADRSFDMVYASHVYEHLGHRGELQKALEGIARILRPGGRFFISVPDLKTLSYFFAHPQITDQQRKIIMCMMFGSQNDAYDFHYVGLWDTYLATLLMDAGFPDVYRVHTFDLFEDTSTQRLGDTLISLNMVAVRK